MSKIKPKPLWLADEFRPTMPREVMLLWGGDAAAELRRLHAENQALRQALEQPAQQDSLWCMKMNGCKTKCGDCPDEVPKQPAPVQEPVAWAKDTGKKLRITLMDMQGDDGWRPLVYGDTTPPAPAQREWVSVKDRLPPVGEDVLTYDVAHPVDGFDCERRVGLDEWSTKYSVSHWMPIPAPPTEAAHGIKKGGA